MENSENNRRRINRIKFLLNDDVFKNTLKFDYLTSEWKKEIREYDKKFKEINYKFLTDK